MINVTAMKLVFWIYLSVATVTSGSIRSISILCMPPLSFRTKYLIFRQLNPEYCAVPTMSQKVELRLRLRVLNFETEQPFLKPTAIIFCNINYPHFQLRHNHLDNYQFLGPGIMLLSLPTYTDHYQNACISITAL